MDNFPNAIVLNELKLNKLDYDVVCIKKNFIRVPFKYKPMKLNNEKFLSDTSCYSFNVNWNNGIFTY